MKCPPVTTGRSRMLPEYSLIDKERVPLEFGTWVHVPGGVRHNFGNTGKGQLMALCIVPPEGDVNPLNGC